MPFGGTRRAPPRSPAPWSRALATASRTASASWRISSSAGFVLIRAQRGRRRVAPLCAQSTVGPYGQVDVVAVAARTHERARVFPARDRLAEAFTCRAGSGPPARDLRQHPEDVRVSTEVA